MSRRGPNQLAPQDVVASFDSATVLHAGLAAALRGQPFPHLGHSAAAAAAIRVGGRLPWPRRCDGFTPGSGRLKVSTRSGSPTST